MNVIIYLVRPNLHRIHTLDVIRLIYILGWIFRIRVMGCGGFICLLGMEGWCLSIMLIGNFIAIFTVRGRNYLKVFIMIIFFVYLRNCLIFITLVIVFDRLRFLREIYSIRRIFFIGAMLFLFLLGFLLCSYSLLMNKLFILIYIGIIIYFYGYLVRFIIFFMEFLNV